MAYHLVDFNATHANLSKDIADAKTMGTYVGNERSWDQTVLKALAELVKFSIDITDDFAKKVTEHHQSTKEVMDQMEALVKQKGKKLDASDLKVLESSVRSIARNQKLLADTSGEMFTALSQYRGGWPANYKTLVSKEALIEPLVKARLKTIDDGKKIDALKQRVEQYAERSNDVFKLAQKIVQASSGAQAQPGADVEHIQEFLDAVAARKNDYETLANKARNSLQQMADLDPKKKPDPKLVSTLESRITNGRAEAKNARGQLKTLTIKVEGFKKIAPKVGDDQKKAAATALAGGAKVLKELEADEKTLGKLEEKADKVWAAIGKLK